MKMKLQAIASISLASLLSGCAAGPTPRNYSDSRWMTEQRLNDRQAIHLDEKLKCTAPIRPANLKLANYVTPANLPAASGSLAAGDRVSLNIAGDEETISGTYVISEDGMLLLPGIQAIDINGLTIFAAEKTVRERLVSGRFVKALSNNVDLRLVESSGVSISVSGAVFRTGTVRVGDRRNDDRIGLKQGKASGDTNPGRSVSTALRAAGGVRPDAAVDSIYMVRGVKWTKLDLGGNISGTVDINRPLAAADRLIVPSRGCFDAALVRPSAITAPGIRVFMSNLARSANNNGGAAIGKETTSLPYGTRLLQGAVALNCIGGSAMNAGRKVVLVSRNPINGKSVVVERKVESLIRHANRDDYDPYLMPNDALACYDSAFMNFRDALGMITDTATPALIFGKLVN